MSCWGKLSYFRPFQELLFKCLLHSIPLPKIHLKVNFGQVTSGTLVSLKTSTLSRFSATTPRLLRQSLISIFRSKSHHSAVSSTSLFYKKIQFSYNPKERCGFITTVMGDGNQCELLTLG